MRVSLVETMDVSYGQRCCALGPGYSGEDTGTRVMEEHNSSPLRLLRAADLMRAPVDLVALAAHLEIRLLSRSDLPTKVAGFLFRGPCWDVIVVNADHGHARRRFTSAHELGHWALDQHGVGFKGIHRSDSKTERLMNAFAATLLMPEELVRAELQAGTALTALPTRFGVSPIAFRRRLLELDLVPSSEGSDDPWADQPADYCDALLDAIED